jgi:hypothetical protein
MRLLVIGGSDAGIRARELDPSVEATVFWGPSGPTWVKEVDEAAS